METPEQCVKSVHNYQQRHQNDVIDVALVSLLLTLNHIILVFPLLTLS